MSNRLQVTVVILAKDERINLGRILPVLVGWAEDVVLIDSGSSDGTQEYAASEGARVLPHPYEYHAQQVNWALDNLGPEAKPWILLLNADELPDERLREEIRKVVDSTKQCCAAYYLNFKIMFMGRWIKYGGFYPFRVVRFFQRGKARCEERKMDEKLLADGRVGRLEGHVIDNNLKDLSYWVEKHNAYSSREAQDYLQRQRGQLQETIRPGWTGDYAARKRSMKKLYDRLPLLYRARWYYWYRVWVRLGFLDGPEGRIWHYLQGYWYRYLVDVKILGLRQRAMKGSTKP